MGTTTRVMRCSCEHTFQDNKYGKGKRMHNESKDGKSWKCTVCADKKGG